MTKRDKRQKKFADEQYKKGYLLLFNCITDALQQMERMNFGQARELLVKGQQRGEELFLSEK